MFGSSFRLSGMADRIQGTNPTAEHRNDILATLGRRTLIVNAPRNKWWETNKAMDFPVSSYSKCGVESSLY
jgi:hypothetical protein